MLGHCMNSYLLALQTGGTPGWLGIVPLIFIFAIFYLVLIMPQQRKQKKWQAMLGELKTGDKVVTSGGLHGIIVALKDEYVHLRVPPDNLRLEVTRGSIVSVITQDDVATTK
jgi:preprotein translocase subunit YajC